MQKFLALSIVLHTLSRPNLPDPIRQLGISSTSLARTITSTPQHPTLNPSMATAKAPVLPSGEVAPADLPKLSPSEFKAYNRMADMMEYYHNHFRQTWNTLYTATSPTPTTSPSLPASRLITLGLSFLQHLTVHHDIEETHIFPHLATRMPSFRAGSVPLEQHKEIHKGMDELEVYLRGCRSGERELRRDEVRSILDGFGGVLWAHLEGEVKELGAESMRRFWSKEEIAGMPM